MKKSINRKKLNIIIKGLVTLFGMFIISYAFYNQRNNENVDLVSAPAAEETSSALAVTLNNNEKQNEESFDEALKNGKISNVLISKVADKSVTLFYYGKEKTFSIANAMDLKDYVGQLCEIEAENGMITKVSFGYTVKEDYLLHCKDDYMLLEDSGKLSLSKDYVIIRKTDIAEASSDDKSGQTVKYTYMQDVAMNNEKMKVTLYTKDDKVCGIIYSAPNLETISVLIKNNDYTKINHEKVSIGSKSGIIVKTYNNSTKVKITKDVNNITLTEKDDFTTAVITGTNNNPLSITSLKRSENITYQGSITVLKTKDGLVVVNTLPLENYLYGVLPGEMPKTSPKEAYKAQAICARTYALDKMRDYKYKEYGAALDDSTTFQVYNKNPRTKEAIGAVDETKGLVLVHKEKLATTCYFSTSCGYIADATQVFGGSGKENMKAMEQTAENALAGKEDNLQNTDLSKEKAFKAFIDAGFEDNNEDGKEYIEENTSWYRWKTTIDYARLEKTHSKSKWDVGKIKKITVKERYTSGVIDTLSVEGTEKTIEIKGQSDIRKYLAPVSETVICKGEKKVDGKTLSPVEKENMKLLPSGFFYISESKDKKSIAITGGGYGHGTGMSQYGAIWLAKAGFDYEEILNHYFKDCIIVDSLTRLVNP